VESPDRVAAAQVRALRRRQGLSQQRLAERVSGLGLPLRQAAVARLEAGRTRNLSVADLFAFAAALDVAPVHLLAASFDEEDVPVVGKVSLSPRHCRDWIRGRRALPDADARAYQEQVAAEETDIYRLIPSLFLLYMWISDLEEAAAAGNLAVAEHALQVIEEQVRRLRRDLELNPKLWEQKAQLAHAKKQHGTGRKP
jgi:transcriptional regulator with XRE-family HTH domain